MIKPLHTLILAADKLSVAELHQLKAWLTKKYGKQFILAGAKEPSQNIYEEVYKNIDIYQPKPGEKVEKCKKISTDKMLNYLPVGQSEQDLN